MYKVSKFNCFRKKMRSLSAHLIFFPKNKHYTIRFTVILTHLCIYSVLRLILTLFTDFRDIPWWYMRIYFFLPNNHVTILSCTETIFYFKHVFLILKSPNTWIHSHYKTVKVQVLSMYEFTSF